MNSQAPARREWTPGVPLRLLGYLLVITFGTATAALGGRLDKGLGVALAVGVFLLPAALFGSAWLSVRALLRWFTRSAKPDAPPSGDGGPR